MKRYTSELRSLLQPNVGCAFLIGIQTLFVKNQKKKNYHEIITFTPLNFTLINWALVSRSVNLIRPNLGILPLLGRTHSKAGIMTELGKKKEGCNSIAIDIDPP
jgi:hypothetical protein